MENKTLVVKPSMFEIQRKAMAYESKKRAQKQRKPAEKMVTRPAKAATILAEHQILLLDNEKSLVVNLQAIDLLSRSIPLGKKGKAMRFHDGWEHQVDLPRMYFFQLQWGKLHRNALSNYDACWCYQAQRSIRGSSFPRGNYSTPQSILSFTYSLCTLTNFLP